MTDLRHRANENLKNVKKRFGGFEAWRIQVDALVTVRFGMGIDDFPDQPWHSYYDDGDTPLEAAEEFISDVEEGIIT